MWDSNFLENALRPFEVDPKIGGVTPRFHPIERRTIWQMMTDIFWDMRNYLDMPAQTAGGRALSCLSGKTALYRREILEPKIKYFLNEIILGRKKESGEDKCFTRLVQQEGWKTYYQSSAIIYSSAAPGFDQFIRQRIRWARNSHNSDFAEPLERMGVEMSIPCILYDRSFHFRIYPTTWSHFSINSRH